MTRQRPPALPRSPAPGQEVLDQPLDGLVRRVFASLEYIVQRRITEVVRVVGPRLDANGQSVIGLIRRVRGEEAMRLLRETDLPLAQIADRVGYADVSTLRTLVLRLSGQTPAALRRRGLTRGVKGPQPTQYR